MKSFTMAALALVGSIASAQTADWYAARFGFNAAAPDLYGAQSPTDYKNYGFHEGNPSARWNTSTALMTAAGAAQTGPGRAWNDPANYQWTDLYEMTDLLPKGTWVRVAANLGNHFPNPYNPTGHVNAARNYGAIISRIMFRGNDLSNGLNLLWNLTPGVYPNTSGVDPWTTITVNPWGTPLSLVLATGDSAKRDWWRPNSAYLPYLRNHVQGFVYDVNDYASTIVRQRTGSGTMTENFIARMGFQLGNEPAAGHPGGSIDGQVGSWTGVGTVLEKTTAGVDYKTHPAYTNSNQVPTNFGTNPLTMPAFSMFADGSDSYRLNYVKGQLRNIQWAGSWSAGMNELATYYKEMQGMNWPTMCGRRALHFNSPIYRWRLNNTSSYGLSDADAMLTSRAFDPSQGRWETPQEYAKRWVAELCKQVDLVANLQMPGSSHIVDVTECYFTGAQSGGLTFDNTYTYSTGGNPNLQQMTFDQIRQVSRSNWTDNQKLTPYQQLPASREAILSAIRDELYRQDMAGTLSPNLGRIYWWGAYYADPRNETGLQTDANNNVTGYNPWSDYRLTFSEMKALWGVS